MDFDPEYTPIQMMEMGVFGGAYFAKAKPDDFKGMNDNIVKLAKTQIGPFSIDNNYFKVKAGQTHAEWVKQKWIFDEDPLGWFQWYCRYHSGRRHERDDHQIQRWINYNTRFGKRNLSRDKRRDALSLVVKQGLLQWSCKFS